MQSLQKTSIPSSTSPGGTSYTATQVAGFIVAASAQERWIVDRLDATGRYLSDLTPYVVWEDGAKVDYDSTAAAKRTLALTLRGDAPLTQLSDMIRPHYQLRAPDGGWLDWPLGTFTILMPQRTITRTASWLAIKGIDVSQLLIDGGFTAPQGVAVGSSLSLAYRDVLSTLLTSYAFPMLVMDPGGTLTTALNWKAGDTRLQALNDIAAAFNCLPPWFDALGVLRTASVPDYTMASSSFSFDTTTGLANVVGSIDFTPDPTRAFNQVLVTSQTPTGVPFSVFYQNSNPTNPISTKNWHAKLAVVNDSRIVDVPTASRRAVSEAQAAARCYTDITVNTMPWPFSEDQDVYQLVYLANNEPNGKQRIAVLETKWSHVMKTGMPTQHVFQPIFPV